MKKILVCEDEDSIRDFIVLNLTRAGYVVSDFSSGEAAKAAFDFALAPAGLSGDAKDDYDDGTDSGYESDSGDFGGGSLKVPFDIAVLDIMMPGIDGVTLCKHIRGADSAIGIVMLSAKSQEMDKVNCLMLGADDYVTKPFSPSELLARIDAVYRRVAMGREKMHEPDDAASAEKAKPSSAEVITSGPFLIKPGSRTVTKNGKSVSLTQSEYHILELFIKTKGETLPRKNICREIWGENYYGDEKIVDVNIRRLRMKIEDNPGEPEFIQTVWGAGYRWSG
ncbi:DNA-binding response regulator [Clostridia bacterium]|nr:DNA-binding response regulator [Clostridia bacterium]